MTRPTHRTILAVLAVSSLALAAPVSAQQEPLGPNAGDKGLSFVVPSGGGSGIGVTYFLTQGSALRIDVAFDWQLANAQPTGGTDFAFNASVGYRVFLAHVVGGRVHPFLQPAVSFGRSGGANPRGTLAFSGSVGVEFFLLEHFSLAGATGLALEMGNLGGTGGASVGITTGTSALYASFYF
jgi:hypothetical protein